MPTAEPAPMTPPTDRADCPLCGVAPVARPGAVVAPETGAAYGIVACPRCGLGRTRPAPADPAPYYGPAYYGNRHGATARLCRHRRLKILRRHAGPGDGRRLLDYGCGDGDFARAARARGWDAVGLERQPPAGGDLPVVASLDELAGRPPFAAATFWHVLEHLPDPVATLAATRDHLEPGGVVLAAVPNFASWQARAFGAHWLHLDLPRHLWHFTPGSLARAFGAAGFAVDRVGFGEVEYDAIGWAQGLLDRHLGGRGEFFRSASGRPARAGESRWRRRAQAGLGLGLAAPSAALALVEAGLGRGGTILLAARARG